MRIARCCVPYRHGCSAQRTRGPLHRCRCIPGRESVRPQTPSTPSVRSGVAHAGAHGSHPGCHRSRLSCFLRADLHSERRFARGACRVIRESVRTHRGVVVRARHLADSLIINCLQIMNRRIRCQENERSATCSSASSKRGGCEIGFEEVTIYSARMGRACRFQLQSERLLSGPTDR